MTHLPYVMTTYILGLGIPVVLGVLATLRLARASRRLDAIDPRRGGA